MLEQAAHQVRLTTNSDRDWQEWGKQDPYYAVLTSDAYRSANLDEGARRAFFAQGDADVAHAMALIEKRLRHDFRPRSVLDFGCGVGRTTLAFARLADEVVGVDVSAAMLEEARANLRRAGADNVRLARIEGPHVPVDRKFDLVYSYIVLQHIPPARGLVLFKQLVDAVAPGGVGLLHLTYSRSKYAGRDGLPRGGPRGRRLAYSLKRLSRFLRGKRRPAMEMNAYNMNQVLFALQSAGVSDLHVEFTDHGGYLGMFLCFAADS